MVFHWSLSDSKSPQISRTRLRILAVLSNAVAWIVSTRPPNFKSSRPFNNPFVIVLNAPFTIGTIVTFMFHSFFQFSSKVEVIILFFTFLQIYSVVRGTSKSTILQVLFFLLIIMRSGLLAGIRWSVCMLKSHRSLCESFSKRGAGLCIYHLFVWSTLRVNYFTHLRVFYASVSWWFSTGVWAIVSLLKSPGLFSVFWPFSIMLLFEWSSLGRQLPSPPGPLVILQLLLQTHQLQLV